jgi:hypothetical protein
MSLSATRQSDVSSFFDFIDMTDRQARAIRMVADDEGALGEVAAPGWTQAVHAHSTIKPPPR